MTAKEMFQQWQEKMDRREKMLNGPFTPSTEIVRHELSMIIWAIDRMLNEALREE